MSTAPFESSDDVRAALRDVIASHGPQALSAPDLMAGILSDVLPGDPRAQKILVSAAEEGVADALRDSVAQGMDIATAARLAASAFARKTLLLPDVCSWIVREFAVALGLATEGAGYPAIVSTGHEATAPASRPATVTSLPPAPLAPQGPHFPPYPPQYAQVNVPPYPPQYRQQYPPPYGAAQVRPAVPRARVVSPGGPQARAAGIIALVCAPFVSVALLRYGPTELWTRLPAGLLIIVPLVAGGLLSIRGGTKTTGAGILAGLAPALAGVMGVLAAWSYFPPGAFADGVVLAGVASLVIAVLAIGSLAKAVRFSGSDISRLGIAVVVTAVCLDIALIFADYPPAPFFQPSWRRDLTGSLLLMLIPVILLIFLPAGAGARRAVLSGWLPPPAATLLTFGYYKYELGNVSALPVSVVFWLVALVLGILLVRGSGRHREGQPEPSSGVGPPVPHDQAGRG